MTISDPSLRQSDRARPATGGTPSAGLARRRLRGMARRDQPLWMLLPGTLLLIVVVVIPLLVALQISLLDLDQYTLRQWTDAPFIRLDNFVEALRRSPLPHAIWLSTSYAVVVAAVALPVGVAAALATQNRFRGRGLTRSIFLIPYVLPAFVVGTVWRIILQPDGVANRGLSLFGVDGGLWLNGPKSYLALIIVQLWSSWPLVYLLALAGLQAVDPDVHEAAALDGATWWVKLRFVVFPYLRGPVALALLISLLHNINAFTLPFVLFGVPSPRDVEVLPVLTYVESFQNFRFGLSAAMAVLSLIVLLVPLAVYLRAVRLDVDPEGETS